MSDHRSGPSTGTTLWLATRGGRADRLRITSSAFVSAGATIALLAAGSVYWVGPGDGPYASDLLMQEGLRRGVALALVLLSIPVLALVGQCSRIGAPARDQRLAAYRLAGAGPKDVARVAGAETIFPAGIGALVGGGVFMITRTFLNSQLVVVREYTVERVTSARPGFESVVFERVTGPVHLLPTDADAPWWFLALVIIGLPLVTAIFGRLALRKVVTSPFGVVRRAEVKPPRVLPAVLFGVGLAGLVGFAAVREVVRLPEDAVPSVVAVVLILSLLCGVGLIGGIAAISSAIGRTAATHAPWPELLIAARRLSATPHNSSRAHAVILLVVLIGGAAQGVRSNILITTSAEDNFYIDTLNLVNLVVLVGVVLATVGVLVYTTETVVTSRRSLASLVATGVPVGVLRRSLLLETMLPLIPTTLLAASAGLLAARGVLGTTHAESLGTVKNETIRVIDVPVPWAEMIVLVLGAVIASAAMAAIGLASIKKSVDAAELRTTA